MSHPPCAFHKARGASYCACPPVRPYSNPGSGLWLPAIHPLRNSANTGLRASKPVKP